MAIPPWAVDALRRGVGSIMEKVPPETIDQLKKRAGDLLTELPQSAARGVDSVMRGAKAGKQSVQRWARRHVSLITPVVNASGCLSPNHVVGVPLSAEAVEVADESVQSGLLFNAASQQRLVRRISKCVVGNDLAILIASSVDGACLAVAASKPGTPFFFHRSQSPRLPSGTPIPDAFSAGHFAASGTRVQEVGSADRIDANDGRSVPESAVVVAVDIGSGEGPWFQSLLDANPTAPGSTHSSRGESGTVKLSSKLSKVLYMPAANWSAGEAGTVSYPVTPEIPSVLNSLASDLDLIITPGNGILGGPKSGLIIGKADWITAIARSPIWLSVEADLGTQASVVVTLESHLSGAVEEIPVQAMLRTAEENLRSRAERLAIRLAAEPAVRSCQITASPASLIPAGKWALPSRQLRLAHRDLAPAHWAEQLANEVPAVLVGHDEEAIIVDLRWIQPSDDVALVQTLVGPSVLENAPAAASKDAAPPNVPPTEAN